MAKTQLLLLLLFPFFVKLSLLTAPVIWKYIQCHWLHWHLQLDCRFKKFFHDMILLTQRFSFSPSSYNAFPNIITTVQSFSNSV